MVSLLRLRALAHARRISEGVEQHAAKALAHNVAREVRVAVVKDAYRRSRLTRDGNPTSGVLGGTSAGGSSSSALRERARRAEAAAMLQRAYRGRVASVRVALIDRPLARPPRPLLSLRLNATRLAMVTHAAQTRMILSGQGGFNARAIAATTSAARQSKFLRRGSSSIRFADELGS